MTQFTKYCLVFALVGGAAWANDDNITKEVGEHAQAIAATMRKLNKKEIGVRQPIRWSDGSIVAAGPGLVERLADRLAREGMTIRPGAADQVEYVLCDEFDQQTNQPCIALHARLRVNGVDHALKPRMLFGEDALARLKGVTVSIPPKTPARERIELIVPSVRKEMESVASPYRMEILVREPDGVYRPRSKERNAVKLGEFDTYWIQFSNDLEFDTVVDLSLDGLPWDAFADPAEDARSGRLILVRAKSKVTLRGWYKNASASLKFDVVKLPSLAAAEKPAGTPGVITATFRPAWEKGRTPPPGETEGTAHRSLLQTAAVREQADQFNTAERQIGKIRAVVSIHYGK